MPIVQEKNRLQLEFKSLEDYIEQDNTVRFIDAFVEKLELSKLPPLRWICNPAVF